jgi:hypothetical protein
MRKAAFLFALFLITQAGAADAAPSTAGAEKRVDLELVLAIDTSGSIDEVEGRL